MFIDGHLAAGIVDVIACVGWGIQTLGNAFYYRQVLLQPRGSLQRPDVALTDLVPPKGGRPHVCEGTCHGHEKFDARAG